MSICCQLPTCCQFLPFSPAHGHGADKAHRVAQPAVGREGGGQRGVGAGAEAHGGGQCQQGSEFNRWHGLEKRMLGCYCRGNGNTVPVQLI